MLSSPHCPYEIGDEVRLSPGGKIYLVLDVEGDEATIGCAEFGEEFRLPWIVLFPSTYGDDLFF